MILANFDIIINRVTSVIESLFGSKVQRTSKCSNCGRESERDNLTLITALAYPETTQDRKLILKHVLKFDFWI